MANRAYGQYCGFARALEILGERWALLIVRDLFVGPRRFSDLQRGLGAIPSNILTARLKELEESGVIARRALPRSEGGSVVYELTRDGLELERAVIELSRWGAKRLGEFRPDEMITEESMVMALRTTFRSEAAKGVNATYELQLGPIALHAVVKNGRVTVAKGAAKKPDVIIEAGPAVRALMAGEISPAEAIKTKVVNVRGDRKLFTLFPQIFRI